MRKSIRAVDDDPNYTLMWSSKNGYSVKMHWSCGRFSQICPDSSNPDTGLTPSQSMESSNWASTILERKPWFAFERGGYVGDGDNWKDLEHFARAVRGGNNVVIGKSNSTTQFTRT